MNWTTIKSLSNVIYIFSNDVNYDEGFFLNVRCLYNKKIQRIFYQTRLFISSKKWKIR